MALFPATAVEIEGLAVLFEGPTGAGKSDLALRCIQRGATLIGDDFVMLEKKEGRLYSSPPENIAGKLEARGLGIFDLPTGKNIPVILVMTLVPRDEIPRMPQQEFKRIEGVSVPWFRLHAFDPSAPDKVFLLVRQKPA